MAKSDARFEYKADLSRTDHDLSQPFLFSCAPGMLLPIWFDKAEPGDSYYMKHDLPLLRSQVLSLPSMVDVKVHYETFFVPMQMIYQPFENSKYNLYNIQSSLYDNTNFLNNALPLLNYSALVTSALSTFQHDEIRHDCFRMADLLELNPNNFLDVGTQSTPHMVDYQAKYTPNFFPWQLLAYHTIFQYYFRLDDKSQFNNSFANWDQYYDSATHSTTPNFFEIHQRPWNFDYFTSIYRSPIVSDVNMQQVLNNGNVSQFANIYPASTLSNMQLKNNGSAGTASNDETQAFSGRLSTNNNYALNLNTANIRQLFANEKLAMITGRTKKNYDSQVLAHLGVSVPHDVKHDITMIHHDEYDLNVLEVTSQASTSDAPLGELAGKSYAHGKGESFKFTAPCDGVIMTIFSVEPKKRYQAGFNRINSITISQDFPLPEFDRLGNIPMYRYESGYSTLNGTYANSDIVGWKERYYAFKRKPARSTYMFYVPEQGQNNQFMGYGISPRPFEIVNSYNALIHGQTPSRAETFYIERSACDSMSLVNYFYGFQDGNITSENWNENPSLAYSRDPFIVDSHIKCKKVSWMSKDGEPVYPF